jgi:hypothetical protein
MIKKLSLTTLTLGVLLLSGCGGSSDSTDPMNDKNYIVIISDVAPAICESDEFQLALSDIGLRNFLTRETDNTTSCDTYGKNNNGDECAIDFSGTGDKNCVVGFNEIPPGYRGLTKQTTPLELYNAVELISVNFQ